jgi:hypothetical protein
VLDFYYESLQFVAKARNFICFTYPLAYHIKNDHKLDLFQENQWQLELALETLNKALEVTPVTKFVRECNNEAMPVLGFANMQQAITDLKNNLSLQFKLAESEFLSEKFITEINIVLKKDRNADPKKAKTKENKDDWGCEMCSYWNPNNKKEICVMCMQRGRPKPA